MLGSGTKGFRPSGTADLKTTTICGCFKGTKYIKILCKWRFLAKIILSNGGIFHCQPCLIARAGWWFQPTPLKNMSSSIGMMTDIPSIWKNEKCSKPPTSWNSPGNESDNSFNLQEKKTLPSVIGSPPGAYPWVFHGFPYLCLLNQG